MEFEMTDQHSVWFPRATAEDEGTCKGASDTTFTMHHGINPEEQRGFRLTVKSGPAPVPEQTGQQL